VLRRFRGSEKTKKTSLNFYKNEKITFLVIRTRARGMKFDIYLSRCLFSANGSYRRTRVRNVTTTRWKNIHWNTFENRANITKTKVIKQLFETLICFCVSRATDSELLNRYEIHFDDWSWMRFSFFPGSQNIRLSLYVIKSGFRARMSLVDIKM